MNYTTLSLSYKMELKDILIQNYNIKIHSIKEIEGGWVALAFNIDNKYFLKAYPLNRDSSIRATKNIEMFSNILVKLKNVIPNIPNPIKTKHHTYHVKTDKYTLVLYDYIDGTTIKENKMTTIEKLELSKIINGLHSSINIIDIPSDFPKETYEIESAIKLKNIINRNDISLKLIIDYKDKILNYISFLEETSKTYKNKNIKNVLCHTDIHKWNIIRSKDTIYLIDFD